MTILSFTWTGAEWDKFKEVSNWKHKMNRTQSQRSHFFKNKTSKVSLLIYGKGRTQLVMTQPEVRVVGLGVVDGDMVVVGLSLEPFGGNTPVENKMTRIMTKRIIVITMPRMIFILQFCHHILRRTFRDVWENSWDWKERNMDFKSWHTQ